MPCRVPVLVIEAQIYPPSPKQYQVSSITTLLLPSPLSVCSYFQLKMAMLSVSSVVHPRDISPSFSPKSKTPFRCQSSTPKRSSTNEGIVQTSSSPRNDVHSYQETEDLEEHQEFSGGDTIMYSFTPFPLFVLAALPGAGTVRALFAPFVEIVKTFDLPAWLVHWGHPGNMAVVLFAMGGYGTYLGFRIRYSDNVEEKANAKDLHPKLLAGMFFFFALGATGGVTALLTSDKPILESPHAVTGLTGLALLTIQTLLPTFFEGNPGLRTVHGILGSGIMTLFLVHAALGLQLGLSF